MTKIAMTIVPASDWIASSVPTGFRLRPGMPATADIKVGQRTVLKYLLGGVLPVAQEGMREP